MSFNFHMIDFSELNRAQFLVFITLLITTVSIWPECIVFGGGHEEGFTDVASRHLRTQGAFFFVLIGIDWILQRYDVLFSQGQGLVWGAGYADLNVTRLPSYWIMAVVAIGVAIWLWRSRKHHSGGSVRNRNFYLLYSA